MKRTDRIAKLMDRPMAPQAAAPAIPRPWPRRLAIVFEVIGIVFFLALTVREDLAKSFVRTRTENLSMRAQHS